MNTFNEDSQSFVWREVMENEDNLHPWSESLKTLTKEVLNELPIPSFLKGYCILKSANHQHGKISIQDAISYRYNIQNIESNQLIVSFESVDDLIQAGWVVD